MDATLKEKKLLPEGAPRVAPCDKGGKYFHVRVIALEVVSIFLEVFTIVDLAFQI